MELIVRFLNLTYKGIFDCASLVKELGASYIRFAPIYDKNYGKNYEDIWKTISDEMGLANELNSDKFEVLTFKDRFNSLLVNDKCYDECYIHQLHPILGADLKMYACCNFPYIRHYVVTDLSTSTFIEAWNGEDRMNFINNLDPKQCPSCWYNEQNKITNYMVMDNPIHENFV